MRIVAVADTHLFHGELVVPAGDVFVHAGDLCQSGDLDELAESAAWLCRLPHAAKIVVAGNHDWPFALWPERAVALFTGAVYLQDTEVVLNGVRFYGSPWQPTHNDWAFNLPRGAPLAERWRFIPPGLDILVTHGPPAGFGDCASMAVRSGCQDLRQRVEEVAPRLHLFGHIHQDGGFWRKGPTAYANVTTWECERAPTVIDLDVDTGVVTPVYIPPRCHDDGLSDGDLARSP